MTFLKSAIHFPYGEAADGRKGFAFMERYGMIQPGDRVVFGVSEGQTLFAPYFCCRNTEKRVLFEMLAVHVNHGVRGEAADEAGAVWGRRQGGGRHDDCGYGGVGEQWGIERAARRTGVFSIIICTYDVDVM